MAARALIFFILIAFSSFKTSESCGIATYWAQFGCNSGLREACISGLYRYISLEFLPFGGGRTPVLNSAGHCDLIEDIQFCQSLEIKVLLSLGGITEDHNISSTEDARKFADDLWTKYLAGNPEGPMEGAFFDGIDFLINDPRPIRYWDDLARALAEYSRRERKIYLAAAPRCLYPDRNLQAAIETGLFDYVWVQFYHNRWCDYSGGIAKILQAWNKWSSSLSYGNQLFLGLPVASEANAAYIPPDVLINEVLPFVRNSGNYGGVMLRDARYDMTSGYSSKIYFAVCDALYSN